MMKRHALTLALACGVTAAYAQAPAAPAAAPATVQVPAPQCEPKPVYPGVKGIQDEEQRENFQKQLKAYQDCVRAYVAERKKVIEASNAAIRSLVEEHNALMSKIRTEQDAARAEQDKK